jgi:hypothetical protein
MHRCLSLYFLGSAVLLAQEQGAKPSITILPPSLVVEPNRLLNPAAAPKVCAIPLTNVLKNRVKRAPDGMVVPLPPNTKKRFQILYVTPPAPPCDDKER